MRLGNFVGNLLFAAIAGLPGTEESALARKRARGLLDKSGKVIDSVVKKGKWEGRSKPFDIDRPILA